MARSYTVYVLAVVVAVIPVLSGCEPLPPVSYEGYSYHYMVARGDTNMSNGYPDPPLYPQDPNRNALFDYEASDYMEGVSNDLKEIKESAENASKKITAVADELASSAADGHFFPPHILSPISIHGASNFKRFSGYPLFPDLDYSYPWRPRYEDEYAWTRYRHEVLDFLATAEAYIQDGEHFIANCRNDHAAVQVKGLECADRLRQLETFRAKPRVTPSVEAAQIK
jgi:hypothetical protein